MLVTDPPSGLPNIIVVDFDKADIVKNCDWPAATGASIIANWLAVQPGIGLSLEWVVAAKEIKDDSVAGLLLDPSAPCRKSTWTPQSEDLRYMVAHGGAGMGGYASSDTQLNIAVSLKDGNGGTYAFTNHPVPLGYQVPANLRKGFGGSAWLTANNQNIFAVSLNGKIVVFRKADKTWLEWRASSELPPVARAFGKYLVAAEKRAPRSGNPASAGENEWRQQTSVRGPATRTAPYAHQFTGRLLIYDTDTEKEFSISTNQGDSEVLLIEAGIVYYRSATRVYSAPLTKDGVGEGHLLATSELIRDAHWAFIKH